MSAPSWNRRFLQSTRGRVVSLLRRDRRTVDELAQELELTDNAVRAHLATLERDGIVQQSGLRRGGGKPAYDYDLTPEGERLFPKAYEPVLRGLLDVLDEQLRPDEVEGVLRAVGHRMAASVPAPQGDIRQRLEAAVAVLGELGGLAELEEIDGTYVIRGYSCPLSAVVPDHPEVCCTAETLLTDFVGVPIHEQCDRGERPRCQFQVVLPDNEQGVKQSA